MRIRTLLSILLSGSSFATAFAQTSFLPSSIALFDSLRMTRLSFQRVLNTYTWNGSAVTAVRTGNVHLFLDQRGMSRFVRSSGASRQDEYEGAMQLEYRLSESIDLDMHQRSTVVGGIRSLELDEISRHRLLLGPAWRPFPGVSLAASSGWELNIQQERRGSGPAYFLAGEARDMQVEDLLLSGSASFERSDLGDRRPEDLSARVTALSDFGQGAGNSLEILYRKQNRDLYSASGLSATGAPGVSLLHRGEESFSAGNTLSIGAASDVSGSFSATFSRRNIGRSYESAASDSAAVFPLPSTISQTSFDVSGSASWRPSRLFSSSLAGGISSAEENHDVEFRGREGVSDAEQQRLQARRRSNGSERIFTSGIVKVGISSHTSLGMSGSASILRYDTPDTVNTDDRDEVFFTAGFHVRHDISPGVSVLLQVEGGQSHLVYLSRFQSANNVRVRTLRFSPVFEWLNPGTFRNRFQSEVSASYTVYDFEGVVGNVQSYSYRQASWNDSLEVILSTRLRLEFNGSLRLFERGSLRWKEFRERPERSFMEMFFWPAVSVRVQTGWTWSVGFRYFLQRRYRFNGRDREFESSVGSSGPTVSVSADFTHGSSITFTGWRETQRASGSAVRSLSNVALLVQSRL